MAVDTTLVCSLHQDAVPRRGAAEEDGVELQLAHKKNNALILNFFGPRRRAHFVVVAIEVGGRWSKKKKKTWVLLSPLRIARAHSELTLKRKRAEKTWWMR